MQKRFQVIPSTPQIVAKTSASNSSGIPTAWLRTFWYLLGTNKGSGERLTLVSVLWTSSLQGKRLKMGQESWKTCEKGEKVAHLGKFAHAAYSPASHTALTHASWRQHWQLKQRWRLGLGRQHQSETSYLQNHQSSLATFGNLNQWRRFITQMNNHNNHTFAEL